MTTIGTYEQAEHILARGGVIALPTDTVYGLAVRPTSDEGVAQIYRLKKRPDTVALPVLAASLEQVRNVGIEVGEKAAKLAATFWPGALTMVLPAPHELALRVHSEGDTVGVRIPNDPALLALLEKTGPLCVTSANEHGEPPCTSPELVSAQFAETDIFIIDGGERSGTVSSVVEVGETLSMRRVGAITLEELEAALI